MDAVKFIEERSRMCKSFNKCSYGCPAWGGSCKLETGTYLECEAEKQVEIVEAWSAAHPRKTRQSVFLEQYPEAQIGVNGILDVCPAPIFHSHRLEGGGCRNVHKKCVDCRREFWMQEVE
nr:MAG TPA: hypothetical protein [Caudoviricetes sp.]